MAASDGKINETVEKTQEKTIFKNYFIYRFVDKDGKYLYIGRTNDIKRRILKEHFTDNTHLPNSCYLETEKVEYTEIINESEEVAYEAILINQEKPKYNIQFKDAGNFNICLPKFIWQNFEWEFDGQLNILKALKKPTVSAHDSLQSFALRLYESNETERILTGFPLIDMSTILFSGTTCLIAAVSDMYKTSYALKIALYNSKKGKNVLYINLKDTADVLMRRLCALDTGLNARKIQHGNLTESDWENLGIVFAHLSATNLTFYNGSVAGRTIRDIRNNVLDGQYDLVIIDDLSSIDDFENSYDIDKTLRALKQIKYLSQDAQIPIISLYCLRIKDIYKRQDKRPTLMDLDYSSLQSYNDCIQFLYKDNYYENGSDLEVIIAKNTLGQQGTVKLATANGGVFSLESTKASQ